MATRSGEWQCPLLGAPCTSAHAAQKGGLSIHTPSGLLLPLLYSVLAQAHEMAKSIFGMDLNLFWKSSHKHSKVCEDNFLDYLNNRNPTKMTLMITHASYVSFAHSSYFGRRGCAL